MIVTGLMDQWDGCVTIWSSRLLHDVVVVANDRPTSLLPILLSSSPRLSSPLCCNVFCGTFCGGSGLGLLISLEVGASLVGIIARLIVPPLPWSLHRTLASCGLGPKVHLQFLCPQTVPCIKIQMRTGRAPSCVGARLASSSVKS